MLSEIRLWHEHGKAVPELVELEELRTISAMSLPSEVFISFFAEPVIT